MSGIVVVTPEATPEATPPPSHNPAALTEAEIRADEGQRVRDQMRAEQEQSEQWQELNNLRSRTSEQDMTISSLEARIQELEAMTIPPSTTEISAEADPSTPPAVTPLEVDNDIDQPPAEAEAEAAREKAPKRKPGLW